MDPVARILELIASSEQKLVQSRMTLDSTNRETQRMTARLAESAERIREARRALKIAEKALKNSCLRG